jgi:hypothetical protein
MNTWSPLFSKIVDSSLWDEEDLVVKVFLTMLARKDSDHVVRANAYQIGKWARKSEVEAMKALEVLQSPDTKRIEPQPFEGRRVKKVVAGWLILNGQHYEDLMRRMNRRAYQAEWARSRRQRKKGNMLGGGGGGLPGEGLVKDEGNEGEVADRVNDEQRGGGQ